MKELTKNPLHVPTDVVEEKISDQEALEILQQEGFVEIPREKLHNLARLGIYMKGLGVIKTVRGGALCNQQRLDEGMRALQFALRETAAKKGKVKELCMLARELGYLSDKLTTSQTMLIQMEHQHSPTAFEEEETPTLSFAAGQEVKAAPGGNLILAQNVHFNEKEKI